MPARVNLTPADIDELLRRYQETGSLALAGLSFGVSPNTVKYHCRKRGLATNPEPEGLARARDKRKPRTQP